MRARFLVLLGAAALAASLIAVAPAAAAHSWGTYHWARTANPFTVPLGDNVTSTAVSDWQGHLGVASFDWTQSTVLNSPVVPGNTDARKCRASNARIEVCNARYGNNGWLGLAQIWTTGSHIVKATAKVNDSYFADPKYTATNEQHVMCQEVGHGYGLGHQDESGADLNTCMDYSNALDNPHPNGHDYDQLVTIYGGHTDATSTVSLAESSAAFAGEPKHVQREHTIRETYVVEDFGGGWKKHTFITWALG